MGGLNTTAGVYNQQSSQPSWFDRILGGATQFGSALAGNPEFIKKFGTGGVNFALWSIVFTF